METRVFKSGNSQAVRIPAELAFGDGVQVVEIERQGDALVLRPVGRPLDDLMDVFASFTPDFMAGGREPNEQAEREPLA